MTLRYGMENAWEVLQEQYLAFAPAVSDVLELARACSAEDELRERLDELVDCAGAMVSRRSGVVQAAETYGKKRARYWGFRRTPASAAPDPIRAVTCAECGHPLHELPRGEVLFHTKGMRGPIAYCGPCFQHQAPEVDPWLLAGQEQPAWTMREPRGRGQFPVKRDPSRLAEVVCMLGDQPCVICPSCGEPVPLPERDGDARCGHCMDMLRQLPARNSAAVRRLLADPILRHLLSL